MDRAVRELAEVTARLQAALDELSVRGLRAAAPAQLDRLDALAAELAEMGAAHLGAAVAAAARTARVGDRAAATDFLMLQATVRVFERGLTAVAARELLSGLGETP